MTRDDRKERVIHARIPASLEAEIKRMADRLRIPVSNLVRNILADTVSMVDGVQQNVDHAIDGLRSSLGRLGSKVDHAAHQAGRWTTEVIEEAPEEPVQIDKAILDRVIGWQELLLHKRSSCVRCKDSLRPGIRAYFGVTGNSADRIFLCPACFERMGESDE